MHQSLNKIATSCALALAFAGSAAYGQAPAAAKGSVVVASPTYTTITMEVTVNRPAADVWKRVGGFCDIAEWLQIATGCKILSGKDGEIGAIRPMGGGEVLVGRSELSYTYTQPPKRTRPTTSITERWKRGR